MSLTLPGPLVDAAWLAAQLGDPRLRVIDVTYVMPGSGRDARAEFEAKHVPGAVYFDIDDIGDPVSELPHMLPTPARFAEKVGALGIGNDDAVVAYDSYGLMSAARGWWMFRVFGHDNVAVLDGGLRAWTAAGQPLETGPAAPAPARFKAGFRPALVRSLGNISANLQSGAEQVIDARAAGRFNGSVEETWPGRRPGHIPGNLNLPFSDLLDPETGRMWPEHRLATLFDSAGVESGRPLVATCGSGVTACVLALAKHRLGDDTMAIYDGSWCEWGLRADLPAETGPAR